MSEPATDLGRIAYEAWLEDRCNAQAFFPRISWDETDTRVRQAWSAGAMAVKKALAKEQSGE